MLQRLPGQLVPIIVGIPTYQRIPAYKETKTSINTLSETLKSAKVKVFKLRILEKSITRLTTLILN